MNRHNTPNITKREILKRFQISLSTLDRAMANGKISYTRVGDKSIRFSEEDILRFTERCSAVS